MIQGTPKEDRFKWQFSLYAAAGAFAIFLPLIMWSADFGEILYLFIAACISVVLLIFVIVRSGRRRLSILSMLVIFSAVSWVLVKNNFEVRSEGRWITKSKVYKADVLAQPSSKDGALKHMEWDGWGFAGSDTVACLVFDPNDTLAAEIKSHSSGKFNGIPCDVYRVRRLEQRWYSVLFYTDTDWDHCSA